MYSGDQSIIIYEKHIEGYFIIYVSYILGVNFMADIMGIELRKIKIDIGIDHESLSAKLYIDGKKAGEIINDGWCDELYVEFINTATEKKFKNLLNEYYKQKGIESDKINPFIDDILFINGYYKGVKDPSLNNGYQLTLSLK